MLHSAPSPLPSEDGCAKDVRNWRGPRGPGRPVRTLERGAPSGQGRQRRRRPHVRAALPARSRGVRGLGVPTPRTAALTPARGRRTAHGGRLSASPARAAGRTRARRAARARSTAPGIHLQPASAPAASTGGLGSLMGPSRRVSGPHVRPSRRCPRGSATLDPGQSARAP